MLILYHANLPNSFICSRKAYCGVFLVFSVEMMVTVETFPPLSDLYAVYFLLSPYFSGHNIQHLVRSLKAYVLVIFLVLGKKQSVFQHHLQCHLYFFVDASCQILEVPLFLYGIHMQRSFTVNAG